MAVQLFIRQPRKLLLTDEGVRLKQVLAANFGDIAHEICDLKNVELSGDINISVPPTFAQTWLLPRLKSFIDLYPALRIHLRTRNDLWWIFKRKVLIVRFTLAKVNIKDYILAS